MINNEQERLTSLLTLKKIQRFLNWLPNKKFEENDSYTLASELDKVVKQLEDEDNNKKVV